MMQTEKKSRATSVPYHPRAQAARLGTKRRLLSAVPVNLKELVRIARPLAVALSGGNLGSYLTRTRAGADLERI